VSRGSALLPRSEVRGSALRRHRAGSGWSPEPGALDPLLAEAVLLLRASEFTGDTGDDWPNEGTGGSALNAECGNTVDEADAGTPVWSASPIPGFQMADDSSGTADSGPFYSIAHSALLDPGTGSFTAFAWVTWQFATGTIGNIMSKIDDDPGPMGAGGTGWQIVDGPNLGNVTAAIASSGGAFGAIPVGLQFITAAPALTVGEHLLVIRLDVTGDISLFVDGVESSGDGTQIGNIAAVHELIFGRGPDPHRAHAYGYWSRALTDTEITTDLPAALGL
jgi:hypothetical protein